jgi:hypothetical protein
MSLSYPIDSPTRARTMRSASNTGAPFAMNSLVWALVICFLALGRASSARAADDAENTAPTAWWLESGLTAAQVSTLIKSESARIIDLKVDGSLDHYTVTYVKNTSSYAKEWWYYMGIDAATLGNVIASTGARLTSLQAYDNGSGTTLFNITMIANTGSDAKSWWYYYGQSFSNVGALTTANNARLTALESYTTNGQTLYAVIMIANTGSDAKSWWYYANVSPQRIGSAVSATNSRIIDLTSAANGNFNAVMESCSNGCPAWWWYYGLSASATLTAAQNSRARVFAADPYPGCGSNCLASLMISDTPSDVTACDNEGCISEAKLEANICGDLANHVVGYVCVVGSMQPQFGGLARTATDGQLSMTPSLTTNVASVSKTMTATAIVQLLTAAGVSPDASISKYLYSDWVKGPNISKISFRDLLTHKSGLAQQNANTCEFGATYTDVEAIVATGVTASNIGQPQYGNCNFTLLRELMPALLGQSLTNLANNEQERGVQSSLLYVQYLQSHVFSPVGVTTSCTPPTTSNILSYPDPAGSTPGTNWTDWSLECGAAGWQLSAFDIFAVLNSLATTNTLLDFAQRGEMFTGCLGWDCAIPGVNCPTPYVCKNGALSNGSGTEEWLYAGIVKCNVPVVVIVNSPLPAKWEDSPYNIIDMVANAYSLSQVTGSGKACTNY